MTRETFVKTLISLGFGGILTACGWKHQWTPADMDSYCDECESNECWKVKKDGRPCYPEVYIEQFEPYTQWKTDIIDDWHFTPEAIKVIKNGGWNI